MLNYQRSNRVQLHPSLSSNLLIFALRSLCCALDFGFRGQPPGMENHGGSIFRISTIHKIHLGDPLGWWNYQCFPYLPWYQQVKTPPGPGHMMSHGHVTCQAAVMLAMLLSFSASFFRCNLSLRRERVAHEQDSQCTFIFMSRMHTWHTSSKAHLYIYKIH